MHRQFLNIWGTFVMGPQTTVSLSIFHWAVCAAHQQLTKPINEEWLVVWVVRSIKSYLGAQGMNPQYVTSFYLCGFLSNLCGLSARLCGPHSYLNRISSCVGLFPLMRNKTTALIRCFMKFWIKLKKRVAVLFVGTTWCHHTANWCESCNMIGPTLIVDDP